MRHVDDIEKLLAETAWPSLVSGPHRERLKQQLLENTPRKVEEMSGRRIRFATRKARLVAACAAALLLVAGAWGSQIVVRRFTFHEKPETKTLTAPDGTKTHLGTSSSFSIESDDPNFTEAQARQQYEGIKKAIEKGDAELIETKQIDLGTLYIYQATLDDGQVVTWGTGRKLYDPNGFALNAEFEQAVVEKRGEVLKIVENEIGRTYIYRVTLSDGSTRTYGSQHPPAEED